MSTPHVLFCAFAEVPGPSAIGTRLFQWIASFPEGHDVDALTVKGRFHAHIQRVGVARMMRVPVEGKDFNEALGAYQRALTRQLTSEVYELIYCADIFSASVVGTVLQQSQTPSANAKVIVEVDDLPSRSFEKRYSVESDDHDLKANWKAQERRAFLVAHRVIAPSRYAARVLAENTDPRAVRLVPRGVDTTCFKPPSMELRMDDRPAVLVLGGREGGKKADVALALLQRLHRETDPEKVRLQLGGTPSLRDDQTAMRLSGAGVAQRVQVLDTGTQVGLAECLNASDIVVVPSRAENGLDPFAVPFRALEAMACQRATIVTGPEASFRDVMTSGQHAVVVPEASAGEVVQAVLDLIKDSSKRTALAHAGRRQVVEACDLAGKLQTFADLMNELCESTFSPHVPIPTGTPEPGYGEEASQVVVAARVKAALVSQDFSSPKSAFSPERTHALKGGAEQQRLQTPLTEVSQTREPPPARARTDSEPALELTTDTDRAQEVLVPSMPNPAAAPERQRHMPVFAKSMTVTLSDVDDDGDNEEIPTLMDERAQKEGTSGQSKGHRSSPLAAAASAATQGFGPTQEAEATDPSSLTAKTTSNEVQASQGDTPSRIRISDTGGALPAIDDPQFAPRRVQAPTHYEPIKMVRMAAREQEIAAMQNADDDWAPDTIADASPIFSDDERFSSIGVQGTRPTSDPLGQVDSGPSGTVSSGRALGIKQRLAAQALDTEQSAVTTIGTAPQGPRNLMAEDHPMETGEETPSSSGPTEH